MKISFSQRVSGMERKDIAAVIAGAAGEQYSYSGAPGFAYHAGGWTLARDGVLLSPEAEFGGIGSLRETAAALFSTGLSAEGLLTVYISGIPEPVANRVKRILESKDALLTRALNLTAEPEARYSCGRAELPFFPALLDPERFGALLTLAARIAGLAESVGYIAALTKGTDGDNDRFAMRCFLLRLGFIGPEYKADRRVLLERLSGNSAYKRPGSGKPGRDE